MTEITNSEQEDYDRAWLESIDYLSDRDTNNNPYNMALLQQCKILGLLADRLFLAVPSDFVRSLIENSYSDLLIESLSKYFSQKIQLSISVDASIVPPATQLTQEKTSPTERVKTNEQLDTEKSKTTKTNTQNIYKPISVAPAALNPRYTFETFVVGSSNRFAAAAARAVGESPAKSFNPLFIYGGSGLGKTHLLHAIGNMTLDLYPNSKVQYVSSEEFTNDFINSIREEKIAQFQARYRENDVLLIDDIQFLQGKEQTVNEFFHTFNTLHNASKQVVITSDVAPKHLDGFEDRMRSRFASGLMTDVQPPDVETRIAILQKKAEHEDLQLPFDVLEYIANRISANIRELEGAVIRVIAFASLAKKEINIPMAEQALKDMLGNSHPREITAEMILEQTATYFGLKVEDLISTERTRPLVEARQIAMYLCRELTDLSLPQIGQAFGGKDHTTVMHANRKITREMKDNQRIFDHVSQMTTLINQASAQGGND